MTSPIIAVRTSYAATQIGDRTLHIVRNRHVNAYRANDKPWSCATRTNTNHRGLKNTTLTND
ncbi:hypothetical protein HOLleu_05386 [Holothuria leucospilota]|uniref:Uncharacterized protein n=1 Tax=Holothuria leucospilota TaxID=206669 RepID=A0A9Q0YGM1_HOLLE|nr:hypothetical protein HOLleu_38920 [Holothuria leucospilota]KAJ8028577.1 hypothetical protein HOLleu_30859 [Holothuria leucospilota]KAJ8038271.1 hypothetical protein HOLleu_15648 [Holothuria leucospilota]KAJ8046638.1 hypothetical protein HOLleu_05386 [Holothuria leucospilota]